MVCERGELCGTFCWVNQYGLTDKQIEWQKKTWLDRSGCWPVSNIDVKFNVFPRRHKHGDKNTNNQNTSKTPRHDRCWAIFYVGLGFMYVRLSYHDLNIFFPSSPSTLTYIDMCFLITIAFDVWMLLDNDYVKCHQATVRLPMLVWGLRLRVAANRSIVISWQRQFELRGMLKSPAFGFPSIRRPRWQRSKDVVDVEDDGYSTLKVKQTIHRLTPTNNKPTIANGRSCRVIFLESSRQNNQQSPNPQYQKSFGLYRLYESIKEYEDWLW